MSLISNNKTSFFSNFIFVFSSQIIVLASGIIKTLAIPLLISISEYAYWQLYVFYTIHIAIFTLGYGDGIYLKYGGFGILKLPLDKIRSANIFFLSTAVILSIFLIFLVSYSETIERQIVFFAIALNIIIVGVISNISLTLQACNEMKGYAFLNSADKIFFTFCLILLFFEEFRSFEYLIIFDVISKFLILFILFKRYIYLFFGKLATPFEGLSEYFDSLKVGFSLLVANLSAMLILGVGRLIIEYFGDIESYAQYSLAAALSSMVLVFISALSISFYPVIKQKSLNQYISYFDLISYFYRLFIILILIFYFAAAAFIEFLAVEYRPIIAYLDAIFILTALQGKMQLVNNTFFKSLRLEKQMLLTNLVSLIVCIVLSFIAYLNFKTVSSLVFTAVFVMLIRTYASEIYLRIKMGDFKILRNLGEIFIFVYFLLFTLNDINNFSLSLWIIGAILFLILYLRDFKKSFSSLKVLNE